MNVCLDAFGTEEAEFLGRDDREESVAHKIHASNSHVLKSRLCERDRDKVQSCALQNGLFILLSSTRWKNRIAFWEVQIVQRFCSRRRSGALRNRWTADGRNGSS